MVGADHELTSNGMLVTIRKRKSLRNGQRGDLFCRIVSEGQSGQVTLRVGLERVEERDRDAETERH